MTKISRQTGFTLLEMLVVIAIFAVVAMMAYGGLDAVLNTRQRIEKQEQRTADFQKAYWIMRSDFMNGDDVPILDDNQQLEPALIYDSLNDRLAFTRGGSPNPADLRRSTLARIGYVFNADKDELLRRTWPVLDRAPQTTPTDTPFLTRITALHWRFLDAQGQWHNTWPDNQGTTPTTAATAKESPPIAIQLLMTTKDWGKIYWLFTYGVPSVANAPSGINFNPPFNYSYH